MSTALSVLLITLVGYITLAPQSTDSTLITSQAYGTALAASGRGDYVLIAVLSFLMGAIVTILCIKLKKYKDEKDFNQSEDM